MPIRTELHAENFDLVQIDNEDLHRTIWEIWAESEDLKIKTYSTAEEFLLNANGLNLDAVIFLDSDLGNGKKGHDYVGSIRQTGFSKVILATGYSTGGEIQTQFGFDAVMSKNPVGAMKHLKSINVEREIG